MIEDLIISGLIHNEEYNRKVLPFIKGQYFSDQIHANVFDTISEYMSKYNTLPTKDTIRIAIANRTDLNETQYKNCISFVDNITYDQSMNNDWLVDNTEKFCQDKAVFNAVRESILILDGNSKLDKGSIPKILSDALGVSFDSNVGHSFTDDAEKRFEFYHLREDKIQFDIDILNKITKGGVSRKALIVALAGTGVGKTLFMCHNAASNFMDGKSVLYITMEMAEEKIAERIDANLLNMTIDELKLMTKDTYLKRINSIKNKTTGRLIIKEYPTASAGSNHFRHLIHELKTKQNFIPDIVYIDYLNICISSRLKVGSNVNSYTYVKAIAEELRGLGVEFNVPVVTATQTTRSGYSNSDVELTDTSESFGLPATADFMFALISNEELEKMGQIMVKQLKNRWGDPNYYKRFVVGVDRARMKLFNIEESSQDMLREDVPIMDNSASFADDDIVIPNKKKPSLKGFT